MSESPPVEPTPDQGPRTGGTRYAYMRRDGTLDIVLGSLVAGLGAYAYQFLGGHSLGAEGFAAIGALLTAHFLTFVIILLPIEQFVIRRITLNRPGRIVPLRVYVLVAITTAVAASAVWFAAEAYFESDRRFVAFVIMTVVFHLAFALGRGYLAGYRRFRSYGLASGAASLFRLAIAVGVVVVAPTVAGFAWAQVLGPLVIFLWRPFRTPDRRAVGSRRLDDHHLDAIDDRGLLTGLVLAAAASQALLLAGPLIAGALGASDVQFSITYATLLLARAPLTLGYNLIARVLPPFTEMAARGERRELRAWARGMGIAGMMLAVLGGILGALLGPIMVAIAFGSDFRPSAQVAGLAAAGVVLASAGLFVGQILVARSQPIRLAISWVIALAAAAGALFLPIDDPIVRVTVAFVVGEAAALLGLVSGALMRDRQEGHIAHGYTVAKRSLDIAGSLVLILLLSPVLVLAAIAVRLDSEGPAFFRQVRIGRNGTEFWMVKLRTMAIDHDDEVYHQHLNRIREGVDDDTEYTLRIDEDPRITGVGSVLRRWSLDELPNLWNVLKGSMSLVGPRPLVPAEAEMVGVESPRFSVKPGVTGLAQVRGRDTIPMEDRTRLDIEYVENRSMQLDIRILFETVTAVFRDPGEKTSV